MASNLPNNPGALVIDANVMIALAAKEIGRDVKAFSEMSRFAQMGYSWFAPGVIVAETLYVLCGKKQRGDLSQADYDIAVKGFRTTMMSVLPPPNGDRALIERAEQIGSGYGCSRSADGIYIALAEELSLTRPTTLLTFDQDLVKQAARNAPNVTVLLLAA